MGAAIGSVDVNGKPTPVPIFESAASETKKVTRTGNGDTTLEGLWCYTLKTTLSGASGMERARKAYLIAVKDRGFKVGVKVKLAQQATLSFRISSGWLALTENANVTEDLMENFGADATEKWIGLVWPANTARKVITQKKLHVCFRFRMTVTAVQAMPQPVPVVLTYGGQASFGSHYLLDVRFFTVEPANIKTLVAAIK